MEGGENLKLETLYDMNYVAERYGIARGTLAKWVMKKEIPFIKIGKNIRFNARDLARWEKERTAVIEKNSNTSKVG
jgi:excisionase family DNA binding protein